MATSEDRETFEELNDRVADYTQQRREGACLPSQRPSRRRPPKSPANDSGEDIADASAQAAIRCDPLAAADRATEEHGPRATHSALDRFATSRADRSEAAACEKISESRIN